MYYNHMVFQAANVFRPISHRRNAITEIILLRVVSTVSIRFSQLVIEAGDLGLDFLRIT